MVESRVSEVVEGRDSDIVGRGSPRWQEGGGEQRSRRGDELGFLSCGKPNFKGCGVQGYSNGGDAN